MIDTAVFDLGGVLIDWDPRYLYRKLLPNEAEVETFLATVCTAQWNHRQDEGRTWSEGIEELLADHAEYHYLIRSYLERWPEMLGGPIESTLKLLEALRQRGVRLYALTNWSAETFPFALQKFPFLQWFEGIVVSGEIGIAKPNPEIYIHLLSQYGLAAERIVFVDDQARNVNVARSLGIRSHLYAAHESGNESAGERLNQFLIEHRLLRADTA